MSDLATRLLAAIEEIEQDARERRGIYPSPVVHNDGAVILHVGRGGSAVITWYRNPKEGYGDMAWLRQWQDTQLGWTREAVLRRCAKDREIVEHYCATLVALAAADGTILAGAVKVRLGAYENVLRALAEGYGIEVA